MIKSPGPKDVDPPAPETFDSPARCQRVIEIVERRITGDRVNPGL
jgi:hypothetical protein